MNTMLRWSPTRQFHYDVDDLSERFFGGATDGTTRGWAPRPELRAGGDGGSEGRMNRPAAPEAMTVSTGMCLSLRQNDAQRRFIPFSLQAVLEVNHPRAHLSVKRARYPTSTRL